jgi:hypothetical protein
MNLLRTMPLGFNKEQVVSIPVGSGADGKRTLQLLRDQLLPHPNIVSISGGESNLGRGQDGSNFWGGLSFMFTGKEVDTRWMVVDYDYLKTLDLKLVAGRDFSRHFATDSTSSVIINEAMTKQLGVKNPIGLLFNVGSNAPPLQVVGVVKDFHHESLKHKIKPATLLIGGRIHYIFVKIAPTHVAQSMALLENTWQRVTPQSPFQGSFLDENTNRQYQAEERLSLLFVSAAGLAI